MLANEELIPAPPVVRKRLAHHLREGRLLRALLRLSVRADEERDRPRNECPSETVAREQVAR
jgi:hypothetical protein